MAELQKNGKEGQCVSGLVSIVMPNYNLEKYIKRSIESVVAQTYTDWELLIVDDCSTDRSLEVIAGFSDARIRVLKNEKNSGAAVSRNYALREARGEWIAFLDSDDLWSTDKLEKQIRFMRENGYDFSYTRYREMDEEGRYSGVYVTGPGKIGKRKMHICNYAGCLTVMYRKEAVGLIQIPDIKKRNDWAMWLQVIRKSPCYLLNEDLASYRVRKGDSVSHVKGGKKRLIKYHYRFFRTVEKKNAVSAIFYTGMNLFAVALKKARYRKRVQ